MSPNQSQWPLNLGAHESTTLTDFSATTCNPSPHATELPLRGDSDSFMQLLSPLAFLMSFPQVREWFKLVLVGGAFAFLQGTLSSLSAKMFASLFITAQLRSKDPSYTWVVHWLSRKPSWKGARDVEVVTDPSHTHIVHDFLNGDDSRNRSDSLAVDKPIMYLPSVSKTYKIWHKFRWMTFTLVEKPVSIYSRPEVSLVIRILWWNRRALDDLLQEARTMYAADKDAGTIGIYAAAGQLECYWRHVSTQPKRPFHTIVLDSKIKQTLIDDARHFLDSKKWYITRGVPFRRGYLLYGEPGSGKTSIVFSLAGELGLDIYKVSMSKPGLTDESFNDLLSLLPEKCVALLEDVDVAFSKRDSAAPPEDTPMHGPPSHASGTRVTLSGLLNALDGVGAQQGRILFATTNCYSSLDPALIRPGRMDVHIEFCLATRSQMEELFRVFYLIEADAEHPADGHTVEDPSLVDPDTGCTRLEIKQLASQFASLVPEDRLSMAQIQGYLLNYKTDPRGAVDNAIGLATK